MSQPSSILGVLNASAVAQRTAPVTSPNSHVSPTQPLTFINETTADVLQRGFYSNHCYDFTLNSKQPSTPTSGQKAMSNNGYAQSPCGGVHSSPMSPSMLQRQGSGSLHNTTSLRMKKHSGLGNFKANYFELEMKKPTHKGSQGVPSTTTPSTTGGPNQNDEYGASPMSCRGIEKSHSNSKRNLLSGTKHVLAASFNLPSSQLSRKKLSLSVQDMDDDTFLGSSSHLSPNVVMPHGSVGGNLHQHVLNPQAGVTQKKQHNSHTYAASTPNLWGVTQPSFYNLQQQQEMLSQPAEPSYETLSFYSNQANCANPTNNTNQREPNDFDDMLDSLLNEDVESTFDNVPQQVPGSPFSLFNKDEEDQSLIHDMDNFFLSFDDEAADHLNIVSEPGNDIDTLLPLRPVNAQEVMHEWENICDVTNTVPSPDDHLDVLKEF